MGDWDIVQPSASPIFEAMRSFGYSPQSAIADIIDNSITAQAKEIRVSLLWNDGNIIVVIKDDGIGMDARTLKKAMRLGSRTPREERNNGDLGRFGLGLKTASISQAREFSVATKTAESDEVHSRRWDLDEVEETGEWRLRSSLPEMQEFPEIVFQDHGTYIIWTKCDRLAQSRAQFNKLAAALEKHIGLVFHRFLSARRKVNIFVNGNRVSPIDPFMSEHRETYSDDEEVLPFENSCVTVKPFILPHKSKITARQYDEISATTGWNSGQGFYVYRADRLLVSGSWLGVGGAKEEHTKLARIRLDIPTNLDHVWQVDVKKSNVRPPSGLTDDLRRISKRAKRKAQDVYRFRGKTVATRSTQKHVFGWTKVLDAQGRTKFMVNRENPVLKSYASSLGSSSQSLEPLLRFIEETLPVTQIALEISEGIESESIPFQDKTKEIESMLRNAIDALPNDSPNLYDFVRLMSVVEPFSSHPEVIALVIEELELS